MSIDYISIKSLYNKEIRRFRCSYNTPQKTGNFNLLLDQITSLYGLNSIILDQKQLKLSYSDEFDCNNLIDCDLTLESAINHAKIKCNNTLKININIIPFDQITINSPTLSNQSSYEIDINQQENKVEDVIVVDKSVLDNNPNIGWFNWMLFGGNNSAPDQQEKKRLAEVNERKVSEQKRLFEEESAEKVRIAAEIKAAEEAEEKAKLHDQEMNKLMDKAFENSPLISGRCCSNTEETFSRDSSFSSTPLISSNNSTILNSIQPIGNIPTTHNNTPNCSIVEENCTMEQLIKILNEDGMRFVSKYGIKELIFNAKQIEPVRNALQQLLDSIKPNNKSTIIATLQQNKTEESLKPITSEVKQVIVSEEKASSPLVLPVAEPIDFSSIPINIPNPIWIKSAPANKLSSTNTNKNMSGTKLSVDKAECLYCNMCAENIAQIYCDQDELYFCNKCDNNFHSTQTGRSDHNRIPVEYSHLANQGAVLEEKKQSNKISTNNNQKPVSNSNKTVLSPGQIEQYKRELSDMGFNDAELNDYLLNTHQDMSLVIDWLFTNQLLPLDPPKSKFQ